MKLTSTSFGNNAPIPGEFAFCIADPAQHAKLSQNRNPQFAWTESPVGTKSFVVICRDGDVPSRPDDVNKEGRTVPADLPRVDFYHWVLVDIPSTMTAIGDGEFSNGVTPKGKPGPAAPRGTRQGINDYTKWFAGDPNMAGKYFGYDGPCPPWNDSIVHRYVFTVYALDVAQCPVQGEFTGPEVLRAIQGHVLDRASLTGTYSLNPAVRA